MSILGSKISFQKNLIGSLRYLIEDGLLNSDQIFTVSNLINKLNDISFLSSNNDISDLLDEIEAFLTESNISFFSDELLAISDMRKQIPATINPPVEEKLSENKPVFYSSVLATRKFPYNFTALTLDEKLELVVDLFKKKR